MREYKLTVRIGDLVEVGRFRNVSTKIKKIELDENGQPVIITNKGAKKLLSCRVEREGGEGEKADCSKQFHQPAFQPQRFTLLSWLSIAILKICTLSCPSI